jgi:hypothetical protein
MGYKLPHSYPDLLVPSRRPQSRREHRNYKVDIVILAHAELLPQGLSNRFLSGVRLLFRFRELV